MSQEVVLGCGLIAIGRPWGAVSSSVPTKKEALEFIEYAFENGIRFFDTAPAYGSSEERLGVFLKKLSQTDRKKLAVATKCGLDYDLKNGIDIPNHNPEYLRESINRSIKRLGKIDILQLHKTNPAVVQDSRVINVLKEYQSSISSFGVSVTDEETAIAATKTGFYQWIQFPYFPGRKSVARIFSLAKKNNLKLIINRPLNMGHLLVGTKDKAEIIEKSYRHILAKSFKGVILTGTHNKKHLVENIKLFKKVNAQ